MHVSWLKVSAVATVLLIASACTGGAPQSSGEPQPSGDSSAADGDVTLRWLIEEPEAAETVQALEDHIAAAFEEPSGIDIQLNTLPFANMRTVLQTQLRSGEGPDVFNWGSGPGFGGALAEAGLVQDLTEAYEEHDWEVYDFAVDRVTYDGSIYGIPGEMETLGIFYNADMFADLGIDPPTSLDDLRAASETIREAEGVPMAVGDQEGWEGGHLLSMALSSEVGAEGMEALLNGEAAWDSPEVVSALQLWQEFNEAGFLPESPTSVDYDTSVSMFLSGEAAMLPSGSWLVSEIDANTDFDVEYIPFPAPDGAGIFAGGLGSGPYVSTSTQHPEAAIEFLDFLASPEHARWTVENLTSIPPIPVDTEGLDVSPLFQKVLEDISGLTSGGDFGYNIDVLMSDQFNEAMWNGVQAVLTGQMTSEEVAAELEAAASES